MDDVFSMAETVMRLRCDVCGRDAARVDENALCERCYRDASRVACGALTELEGFVKIGLEQGLTPEQFRHALELSLDDAEGPLPGTLVRREACGGLERGIWLEPDSLFYDVADTNPRNMIGYFRGSAFLTLEEVADQIGAPMSTLALWEQDVFPSEPTEQDCRWFGALCELLGGIDPGFLRWGIDPPEDEGSSAEAEVA
jgi:hypothetical protein